MPLRVLAIFCALALAAIGTFVPATAGASTLGTVPPADPSANCVAPGALSNPLASIDYCRAQEQVGPVTLPSNWSALTADQQMLVIINLERIGRGLAPIVGLNSQLDSLAQTGADDNTDPACPSSGIMGGGGIWAAVSSTLEADYLWMYYDGPGGSNEDCTSGNTSGCWGHRDNILIDLSGDRLIGGAGYAAGNWYGDNSYAFEMDFDPGSNYPDDAFTWSSELPEFASAPAIDPLPVPTITSISPSSGPASGGTAVTITGSSLLAASTLSIGQTQATDLSCDSDQTCTAVTAAAAPGSYAVIATNPAGPSTASAPQFTYTAAAGASSGGTTPPAGGSGAAANNSGSAGHTGTTTTTPNGTPGTVTTGAQGGIELVLSPVRIVHHRLSFSVRFRSGSATVSVTAKRGSKSVRLHLRRQAGVVLVSGTLGSGHWLIAVDYRPRGQASVRHRSIFHVSVR
jgi:hypothetical protein